MTANNNAPNGRREKAREEYVKSILSDGYAVGRSKAQKLVEGVMVGNAFLAGYRAALEWVLEYATEIAEKYKSENFGMPLIPANTLKSKIQKELGE